MTMMTKTPSARAYAGRTDARTDTDAVGQSGSGLDKVGHTMTKTYTVKLFAAAIGISTKTVRRWDKRGVFPARRLPNGHRYYTDDDVRVAMDMDAPESKTKVVK